MITVCYYIYHLYKNQKFFLFFIFKYVWVIHMPGCWDHTIYFILESFISYSQQAYSHLGQLQHSIVMVSK